LLLKFGRKPWQNPATEATLTFQTLPQLLTGIGPFQTFKTFNHFAPFKPLSNEHARQQAW
jgi:hypothetical protein